MAVARRAGIISITVRLRAPDGHQLDVQIDPKEHDAVVLSRDAVDKVLVPFYAVRDGVDKALEFRAAVEQEAKHTGGPVVVLHRLYCTTRVVHLDWRRSTIRV